MYVYICIYIHDETKKKNGNCSKANLTSKWNLASLDSVVS